jgi:hypothetical protein
MLTNRLSGTAEYNKKTQLNMFVALAVIPELQ